MRNNRLDGPIREYVRDTKFQNSLFVVRISKKDPEQNACANYQKHQGYVCKVTLQQKDGRHTRKEWVNRILSLCTIFHNVTNSRTWKRWWDTCSEFLVIMASCRCACWNRYRWDYTADSVPSSHSKRSLCLSPLVGRVTQQIASHLLTQSVPFAFLRLYEEWKQIRYKQGVQTWPAING